MINEHSEIKDERNNSIMNYDTRNQFSPSSALQIRNDKIYDINNSCWKILSSLVKLFY